MAKAVKNVHLTKITFEESTLLNLTKKKKVLSLELHFPNFPNFTFQANLRENTHEGVH